MTTSPQKKGFNLQDRTEQFSSDVRLFIKQLPKTMANKEDGKQLIRSSGSVGANYLEADESLGKGDFLLKLRTSRREAKESRYWLRLIDVGTNQSLQKTKERLIQEAYELLLILSAIIRKCS